MNKKENDEYAELIAQNANNFGASPDMFHPDYGWITKDGKTTEEGLLFFKEQLESFEVTSKATGRA